MKAVERVAKTLRHSRLLRGMGWFWNGLRPSYEAFLGIVGRRGLSRLINGTDLVLVHPEHRETPEEYEPVVWREFMRQLRPGDVVADVGAYVGIYSIAAAKRVQPGGTVYAFEPDPRNADALARHVELNRLAGSVEVVRAAASDRSGSIGFQAGRSMESRVALDAPMAGEVVPCVTLDDFFAGRSVDVFKLDVEGYEEQVLRGARGLLMDAVRRPRVIFVEVHPYAWPALGTTSETLLGVLRDCGYAAFDMDGAPVTLISAYGEIRAAPLDPGPK